MLTRTKLNLSLKLAAILLVAFALKYYYSTATVNELRWILAPTTFLVELLTWSNFTFESHAGYMSADRTFLIAAPCAGVNFLIIAFLMLAVGKLWREWPNSFQWHSVPLAAVTAYAAAILANTTRITVALQMRGLDLPFDYEEAHRIEGIVVYFGFLLLLFLASEFGIERRLYMRRALLPLLIYYAITLGIPFAGGAYRNTGFWQHAFVVCVTSTVVMLPFVVVYFARVRRAITK